MFDVKMIYGCSKCVNHSTYTRNNMQNTGQVGSGLSQIWQDMLYSIWSGVHTNTY